MQIVKNKVIKLNKSVFKNTAEATNFLKFSKFNYNKRMDPTWREFNKHHKIINDYMRMNDMTDFYDAALIMQSDLFHESLFDNLSI